MGLLENDSIEFALKSQAVHSIGYCCKANKPVGITPELR